MCDPTTCPKRSLSSIVLVGSGTGGGFFMTFKTHVRISSSSHADFLFFETREEGG